MNKPQRGVGKKTLLSDDDYVSGRLKKKRESNTQQKGGRKIEHDETPV